MTTTQTDPTMTTTTATAAPATMSLVLQPPEVLTPLAPTQAQERVPPLAPEVQQQIDAQVRAFVDGLMKQDVNSEAFQKQLDTAFRLGREEISVAATLMESHFMQRNMNGMENSPAYAAIAEMRRLLDDLNPGNEGDLLQPRKLLGLIPFGTKLQAYFRKYESAAGQLQTTMSQLHAARDDMERDIVGIDATTRKLWESMAKLSQAQRFAQQLDAQVDERVRALQISDPVRATALQQEVLFYARQNLTDIQTQMAVCINGYLALGLLKKTGREMVLGCTRVATTGMSALAVAQTVARATDNQIVVMDMLQGANTAIGNLITQTGKQLNAHVEATAQFSSDPMIGVELLKTAFGDTYRAMDSLDKFRVEAIDAMGKNNAIVAQEIERSRQYVDRTRQELARGAM